MPDTKHHGLFLQYHAHADDSGYDAGEHEQLRQTDVLLHSAQSLEQLVEQYRRNAVQITSMQLGYADPDSALRVCGVQIAPLDVKKLSPRLWANVPGASIADYADLKREHPDADALRVVWSRWIHSFRDPSARTEPKRVLFMPQPNGDACRLHPIKDEDLLFEPRPRQSLPSVTTGGSSLAAKAHAFRKGQGSYDAGFTTSVPLPYAQVLEVDGAPWSQETLLKYGVQLCNHVERTRRDIERLTSLRVLQIDESTRSKVLGVTVVSAHVRQASPILWPMHPQTQVEAFRPDQAYAKRVLEEWRISRGKEGCPPRVIAVPRPDGGTHMHPLAADDVCIPL